MHHLHRLLPLFQGFVSTEYRLLIDEYPHLHGSSASAAFIVTSSALFYHTAYLLFALVGLGYPLLYSFHLFGILTVFVSLRGVVRAVKETWRQLLLTALLVSFVIYCYAIVAFVYFREYFYLTSNNELACDTLAGCFYFTFEQGLMQVRHKTHKQHGNTQTHCHANVLTHKPTPVITYATHRHTHMWYGNVMPRCAQPYAGQASMQLRKSPQLRIYWLAFARVAVSVPTSCPLI